MRRRRAAAAEGGGGGGWSGYPCGRGSDASVPRAEDTRAWTGPAAEEVAYGEGDDDLDRRREDPRGSAVLDLGNEARYLSVDDVENLPSA